MNTPAAFDAWLTALRAPGTRLAVHALGMRQRRFRAGRTWDTGERLLDEGLIYAITDGQAILEVGGRGRTITAGQVAVVPAGVTFRFRCGATPPQVHRLRLRAERNGTPVAWGSEPVVVDLGQELRRVLDLLADAPPAGSPHAETWSHAGALLLAATLARALSHARSGGLPEDAVARCQALVERQPRCGVTDLARVCGLSHDWFSRAFRRATGQAPRRWLVAARVHLAAQRLADGEDPATVARLLGWQDPKLFGRQFREVLGQPPGRWQRCHC